MSRELATAILVLWRSGHFDACQIARLLGLAEADVSGLVSAACSLELELPALELPRAVPSEVWS